MFFLLPIIFGLAPSFIWLMFFLREDVHPESNKMILKIFSLGMIITIVAGAAEKGIEIFINIGIEFLNNNIFLSSSAVFIYNSFELIILILAGAFIEEYAKYFVVKKKVLKDKEFDEPVDVMLYMIIAALGFAALENIFVLFSLETFQETVWIISLRFVGATFLHALCSATFGYFLALSFFETRKSFMFFSLGIILATFLHGIYNFFILKIGINYFNYIYIPMISLIIIAFIVLLGFKNLRTKASICKIIK